MKSKKKLLMIALPVLLLVVAGGAYKMLLAPKAAQAKPKLPGQLLDLSSPFVINLAGGHYAKLSVALLVENAPPPAAGVAATVPQEPAVRAVITDELTNLPAQALIDRTSRHRLVLELRKAIDAATDNKVDDVLFTDLTIQ